MAGVSRRQLGLGAAAGFGALGLPFGASAGLERAEVPFAVTRNHIWTGVTLDEHGPYPFLIDTGGVWYMVDPDVAAKASLAPTGELFKIHTAAGLTEQPVYRLAHIAIANKIADYNVTVVGLRQDRNDITVGLMPLSETLATTLDFDTKTMIVERNLRSIPDDFQSFDLINARGWSGDYRRTGVPGDEGGAGDHDATHLRRTLMTRQPIIEGKLDGQPIRLMIDSGEAEGLLVFPSYVRLQNLWGHYSKSVPTVNRGLNRDVDARIVRPERLSLGRFAFDRPIIQLADPKSSGDAYRLADGVIGVETLRRLNFINDPSRRIAAFRPSKAFDDVWRYDRAGMSIERIDKTIQITAVDEDGPAWKSGLRKGDVVTGWAGGETPAGASPYFGLLWALQGKAGSRLGIQIDNGGKPTMVGVTLEERI